MAADIIFQLIQVGTLELPNRVLMTTIKLGYGTSQGRRYRPSHSILRVAG